jgi:hypothetical protein
MTRCNNHECPVVDNCWTYGKPLEKIDEGTVYIPERDDEIEFKCKQFENYPQ